METARFWRRPVRLAKVRDHGVELVSLGHHPPRRPPHLGYDFAAIPDDHPGWDALLRGIAGRTRGIFEVMRRHPLGHDCGVCRAWRRQNKALAAIEAQVLARRATRAA